MPAPHLAYGKGGSATKVPENGVWNMMNTQFVDAKEMLRFGLINISERCGERDIGFFVDALTRAGRGMGMANSYCFFFSWF